MLVIAAHQQEELQRTPPQVEAGFQGAGVRRLEGLAWPGLAAQDCVPLSCGVSIPIKCVPRVFH